ncbi:MAG: hypothetical protein A2428_16130 [Bdellovibrionales bacterium RIFOXYC1_FULL_54_43]|nr:MAG: hypothetical protein A2428_16130 [Bdellovibrionales bacterium RIFOXYC1_FULL_54_43]OFZ83013.1 MAG: hypothetical protein A2603_02795 [Bdellovibrionales bacterium RIFOXYD1_FULL_55_31]
MANSRYLVLILGLVVALAALPACSLLKTDSEEISSDEVPAVDAATDAVPEASAEVPPPTDALADTATPTEPPPIAENVPTDPALGAPAPVDPLAAAPVEPAAAEPPTAPEATSTTTMASGATEDYSVQQGDTLMKIAFETYGDLYRWKDIYELNRDRIQDSNDVPVGTVLKVEIPAQRVVIERNGEKYLIKKGDTLGGISSEVYGTKEKWRKLWDNNRQLIRDPNKIFAGFYLYYVPEAGEPQQVTPAPLAGNPGGAEIPSVPEQRQPAADALAGSATTPPAVQ